MYLDKNGNTVTLERLLSSGNREVIKYFFGLSDGCFGPPMSDEQYMQLVKKKRGAANFRTLAMKKLGIDGSMVCEISPVNFEGFSTRNAYTKRSGGGIVTSRYDITWLFFGDEQVYLYSYSFWLDEYLYTELTKEYFYRDITSFSHEQRAEETTTSHGKERMSVSTFTMVVPGDVFACSVEATPGSVSSINAMKQKLREKKSA